MSSAARRRVLLELASVAFIFSREKSSIGRPCTIVYVPWSF